MKVVDNRNTRKNKNKNQTTNNIYDHNPMSVIKKIILKSLSHPMKTKTKQFNIYFIRKDMGPNPNATG